MKGSRPKLTGRVGMNIHDGVKQLIHVIYECKLHWSAEGQSECPLWMDVQIPLMMAARCSLRIISCFQMTQCEDKHFFLL